MDNKDKIILDLCGGTGAWSKPYTDAGYDVRIVTTPEHDVITAMLPRNVYGILAAPPCTHFSLARSTAKTPRNYKKGLATADACFRIAMSLVNQAWVGNVEFPIFFAMENPVAHIRKWYGDPQYIFEPWYFGDNHSKKTGLWGWFNEPKRLFHKRTDVMNGEDIERCRINNRILPSLPQGYIVPKGQSKQSARRAITPAGFAKAFFLANP